MPTITREVTDLVPALADYVDTHHDGNVSAAARALGTSRQRLANWLDGAHSVDLQGDRQLHLQIAFALSKSPREIAALNGMDVSDEVPKEPAATIGDSPRPPKSQIDATLTPVTDLTAARRRRKPEQKPAVLEATG